MEEPKINFSSPSMGEDQGGGEIVLALPFDNMPSFASLRVFALNGFVGEQGTSRLREISYQAPSVIVAVNNSQGKFLMRIRFGPTTVKDLASRSPSR